MRAMDEALPLSAHPLPAEQADVAFGRFFEEHHERLHAALWLVVRDGHEAEEIAQDAFLKVWERWDRVGGIEDPPGYLFRTAMNLYRNRRRRAAVALRRLIQLAPVNDPLAAIEDRDLVVRALGTLTPRQRAALVLMDLLDMSSEEAAKALGVRPPTVRVLAARARTALHDRIGGNDD